MCSGALLAACHHSSFQALPSGVAHWRHLLEVALWLPFGIRSVAEEGPGPEAGSPSWDPGQASGRGTWQPRQWGRARGTTSQPHSKEKSSGTWGLMKWERRSPLVNALVEPEK